MSWVNVGWLAGGLVIGLAAGFFLARWFIKREMKKNPPISEKMIRAMFLSMGRKPSEAQIKQTMKAINDSQGK
ncbi:MAG: YneF family protein [Bacilli bacterium]|jgi:uncharacterized protein|nr:YneF family protein [Bacilli bacterium]MDD3422000.1 YneF family protein [Bacilli bacterium]MDD4066026.1 YneF family protein [Bacilli bacterium]